MRFKRRVVFVDAFQLTLSARRDPTGWPEWARRAWQIDGSTIGSLRPIPLHTSPLGPLEIRTRVGLLPVRIDDWVMREANGDILPCAPDIFLRMFEPVPDERQTARPRCEA